MPIAPPLARELESWPREGEHVINSYGKRSATREFFDLLAGTAGVDAGPNIFRHTVRTWLAESGVPDADADVLMGYKEEGSAIGNRYIHRQPEYLCTVSDAELAPLVTRSFAGRQPDDQPADVEIPAGLPRQLRDKSIASTGN